MGNENSRSYNCKDEEVPMMASLLLLSFKRDIADFRAFSPRFNEEYVIGYESMVAAANEVVEPKSETLAKKLITEKLHQEMGIVATHAKHVKGYLELAKATLHITPAEFGLNALIEAGKELNLEGMLKQLNLVLANVNAHKPALMAEGLTEEKIQALTGAGTDLNDLKQQQYTIFTNRKQIVQDNLGIFNGLYGQMTDIMKIGKLLYNDTNKTKASEYTVKALAQQVRRAVSPAPAPAEAQKQTTIQ